MNKNWISFNGFKTLDYNILIEELPVVPTAEEKTEFIEIEGRDGYLTLSQNAFMPIEYEVQLNLYNKNEIRTIKSKFYGSGILILSNNSDLYYKARVTNIISFERAIKHKYICTIKFILQPFGYEIEDKTVTNITNPYTFKNETDINCQPIITINGTGNCVLIVGNHQININNIQDSIILDFEMQEAYKIDSSSKINMNSYVSGVFYPFEIGNTTISWEGDSVTNISINPRYRWR